MVNITFMVNFYYIYGWCYIMIFNLEKIYFPSCSSRMISLHHSFLHVPLDIWKPEGSKRRKCDQNKGEDLQWATKVVETLLGNGAFRYLSICSVLFASSVNSLIPRPPNSMLCRRCGLCSRRNRKVNIVVG